MPARDASTFKPMLAKDGDLSKVGFPLVVQPKLDGIRASVVGGRLVSRTLKLIPNAEIQAALGRPEFEGLDGELIVGSPTDDPYNRTSSFVMSGSKTGQAWTYFVFDKWDAEGDYEARMDALEDVTIDGSFMQIVAGVTVQSAGELERCEALLVDQGYEGAIARVPSAAYKFGRSGKTGPLLKIKRFTDFEARVVGVYEEQHNANVATRNALGRTERSSHAAGKVGKGTLGGLVLVAINGPFEGVEFRCGTGFTAAMRAGMWEDAATPGETYEGLNGLTAKVKFFAPGSKDAPRHPVFLGWRDERDLGEAS